MVIIPQTSKIFWQFIGLLGIVLFSLLGGCGGETEADKTDISSPAFLFTIRVQDQTTKEMLSFVQVTLEIPGDVPMVQRTDSNGIVILQIDPKHNGKVGKLIVGEGSEYRQYYANLVIKADILPLVVMLDKNAQPTVFSETATPTSTNTPLPPTETPTIKPLETYTPTATFVVPTITPTSTIAPTHTKTPIPVLPEPPRVKAVNKDIFVYAGPDIQNSATGTLRYQENGEIVGRTKNGEWLEIITPQGKQGWVAPCEIELISNNLDEVPVTWEKNVTPYNCTDTSPSSFQSTSCLNINISQSEMINKPFDNVTLSWDNVPARAAKLYLSVYRITDERERIYAVHPTFSDTVTSYFIGEWMFENTGATSGTLFTYEVEAQDAASKAICKTSGTLTP